MIRMIQSTSSGHAKSYFSDALSKSDYYISDNDQELQGRFLGRLSARLGVTGGADKKTFFDLCENTNPQTGRPLTPQTKEYRRIGYDINFHCPKSVSLVHVLSKDSHILTAFQESVQETMIEIEADSMTRIRKNGAFEDRRSGELIWADFTHQTARPVDGSAPDPHLHSHCFVFNATWDDIEKRIKAGQFVNIKRDMPYYQARFHKKLSDKLIDQGYNIRRTNKSFEIEGVPNSAIELFSKRTNEIGEFAKQHGITDAKELSELGARTRSKKQSGLTMKELKEIWRKQIQENVNIDADQAQPVRFGPAKERLLIDTKACVEHAIDHSFERASVMQDRRILTTAYRQSIGERQIGLTEITQEFHTRDGLLHIKENNQTMCTMKDLLTEEMYMVNLARKGQGKFAPLFRIPPAIKLKGQQGDAIKHILSTKNQVSIIRGGAGTGKTTLLKEVHELVSQTEVKMFLVAPTAEASRGVLVKEGFKDAETVAKFLTDEKLQSKLYGHMLCVDEAGLLGNQDMTALLELVQKKNARLILMGDTRQHSSVIRGDALRILNTVGKIQTAEVSKIRRQKNDAYRNAVEDLANGDIGSGFSKLDKMGSIKTVDPLKPTDGLIEDYINTILKGKTGLIVSPTNKQALTVSEKLRIKLKEQYLLGKKEVIIPKLTNLNFTEAEKLDGRNYYKGQVIQFNQNIRNNLSIVKRGSTWLVIEADTDGILITNKNGHRITVGYNQASSFDVCAKSEIALSNGDQIKITRNKFDKNKKRLTNGQYLEIKSIKKSGDILLFNRNSKGTYKLDKDFGFIDYSYCTTSHSSQGKTVDAVFISQPASTFPATDAKQFYVSVSRGKEAVTIYTDDKEALLKYASEAGDRQSALELIQAHPTNHRDFILQNERRKIYTPGHKSHKVKEKFNVRDDYEPGI